MVKIKPTEGIPFGRLIVKKEKLMKKTICMLAALAMISCTVSCGNNDEEGIQKPENPSVSNTDYSEGNTETVQSTENTSEEVTAENETKEHQTETAPISENWKDIYYNKLMEVIASSDYVQSWYSGTEFSLEDIDADGTPELFIAYNNIDGVDVYTCDNNNIRSLGEIGNYGEISYIPEKKLLVSTYYDPMVRIITDSYLGLNNRKFSTVITTGVEYNELGELFNWYVNDEYAEKDEYEKAIEMYDGGRTQLGHEFRVNITEIELALYGRSSWQKTYSEYLKEIVQNRSEEESYPHFSLYDITGDGTPELFVSEGTYHAAGVDVFSFDGRLRSIGILGSYGSASYSVESKTISTGDIHMGYEYGAEFEIQNYRFVRVFSYYCNCGAVQDKSEYEFKINNKPVTESQYDSAIEQYRTDRYVLLGNDNTLDSGSAEDVAEGKYSESEIRKNIVQ